MEDYQIRVLNEKEALSDKIEKLSKFIHRDPIFENLDKYEQILLIQQMTHMEAYENVINLRLDQWNKESPN